MRHSFFTVEKLGPKQSITPEGFLLCEDVPIARTGVMIYGPNETPIEPGPDGIVKIFREPEDLFTAKIIASANGKSFTIEHPDVDVCPSNWKELSHGFLTNVRRGTGAQDDLLLADLLVTTEEGIKAIREAGIIEVSLGYDAEYEQLAVGSGKQVDILINHLALVEHGRCGFRCAINDKQPVLEELPMASTTKRSKIYDAIRRAFKAKDEAEMEKIAQETQDAMEEEEGGTHIHLHNNTADAEGDPDDKTYDAESMEAYMAKNDEEHASFAKRLDALEGKKTADAAAEEEEEARKAKEAAEKTADAEGDPDEDEVMDELPEELREEASKTKDSAHFADTFQDTVALAEILVPGMRHPTFDKAAAKKDTFKTIHDLRCKALDLAYASPATKALLDELLRGKTLDSKKLTFDGARNLFRSAATMKRAQNNLGTNKQVSVKDTGKGPQKVTSIAELNQRNAKRYADQQ